MIYHVVKTQPSGTKHAIGLLHRTKYTAERYNTECQARGLDTEVMRFKNAQFLSDHLKAHNAPFYAKQAPNRQAEQYAFDMSNEPSAQLVSR